MTQVDFHFNVPDLSRYGCRLVRKVWHAGHQVVVYCDDTRRLTQFDQALWTFEPLSFIPHVSVRHPLAERTPVLLAASTAEAPPSHRQVLINLGGPPPDNFSEFQRVVELVGTDRPGREAARERFRFYRERGFSPLTHDVEDRDGSR